MIPKNFDMEVGAHVARNIRANRDRSYRCPLIECISGPPGMGKTYQTREALRMLGVQVCDLPGSLFESKDAGEPANAIFETYAKASKYWDTGLVSAIVIDDVDAAIGDWGNNTQYTVNRQLVFSTLMKLADDPFSVFESGDNGTKVHGRSYRVPIFMTCNDAGKLYPPLMRPGRTRIFEWVPDRSQKAEVVGPMFPRLRREEIDILVGELDDYCRGIGGKGSRGVPVALFADIVSAVEDEGLFAIIEGLTAKEMLTLDFGAPGSHATGKSVGELVEMGKSLLCGDENYLEG